MGKHCLTPIKEISTKEVNSRDSSKINANDKLIISRALKNINPNSTKLYQCIQTCSNKFFNDIDCTKPPLNVCRSTIIDNCRCSEDLSNISSFCNLFKSRRAYSEEELQHLTNIVLAKLNDELNKLNHKDRKSIRRKTSEYCIVPVIIRCSDDESESSTTDDFEIDICECKVEDVSLTCAERKALEEKCETRKKPIIFRHFGDVLSLISENFEKSVEKFSLDYVGASDEIPKWGEFLDLVDRVLHIRDLKLLELQMYHKDTDSIGTSLTEDPNCCGDTLCRMPITKYDFDDLNRFDNIEYFGYSTFCRRMMTWSNCTTKRWNCITSNPHVIIHLPSMSYPCHLRSTAQDKFNVLQNIQIGRVGWLENENAQVIYIYPGKSNFDTKCVLQQFIKTARPDVSLSRLLFIENDEKCFCKDVDEEYISGCESLFYTPTVYRRVRYLTAGRNSFIVPGILSKMDIFIACELKTSILGPCLVFQERLLNKHYVMSLLAEANIRHPTFVDVRNFSEESLTLYLADTLPQKLQMHRAAYKDTKDFFDELERHGGVLTACPSGEYRTVSLGFFIEHDTAKACLRTSADVVRKPCNSGGGYSWNDFGYVIPQTTLPDEMVQQLVLKLGNVMLMEQYLGYFGVDLVVFDDNRNGVLA